MAPFVVRLGASAAEVRGPFNGQSATNAEAPVRAASDSQLALHDEWPMVLSS